MTPGDCPNEGRVYGSKSFCMPWDRWTNCREVGHCVYEDCVPDQNQMTIFDFLEEEECDSR